MRNWIFVAFVLAVLCAVPAVTQAQSTASVTGTVTDTSGAAVPGASVVLVDTRTNNSYFGKTAGDGSYRITEVAPGPGYSLTVKKDGFQVFVVNGLYLPVATASTQDVKLELGTVSQKVEVTAEGSVTLDTTDTMIGNNLDMHAISSLPNEFRDNPANLLRLEPGVVSAITPAGGPTTGTGAIDPNLTRDGSIAGARTDQANIIVDGIDQSNISSGFAFDLTATIPVDAIQEFNTIVGNPVPQYGGRSGSQTLITTKSGSNQWHGSAYEYNRTAATEADTFFNNEEDIPRLALVRNQFGGNVGGPVWKDKLFFFFEYDGRRDDESESVEEEVPMDHVKLGELAYINSSGGPDANSTCAGARLGAADVSTSCITILSAAQVAAMDPCSGIDNCSGLPGFQAAGVAPALMSLYSSRYPHANDFSAGDGINTAGFRFNSPNPLIENDYVARADYNLNTKNKLFARFNFVNITSLVQPNAFPGDPLTSPNLDKDRAWVLGDTWTVSPNLINVFTYGESRENTGQPILFNPGGSLYELSFVAGLSNPFVRQTSFETIAPEPTFRDDVTWVHGNHTFVMGGEWNPILYKDGITNDFTFIQMGFGGNLSGLDPSETPADIWGPGLPNWEGAFVGNLGTIFNLQASINYTGQGAALPQGSPVSHDYRVNALAGYFQDGWRIRPSLTLTYGVRYQYDSVPYETHGVQASFQNTNFKSIVATRIANGLAGIFGPDVTPELTYELTGKVNHAPPLYSPEYHDFSPRLGLAWNPNYSDGLLGKILGDHKTVVRLGGSIIFDDTVINNIVALQNQGDYTFGGSFAENFGSSVAGTTPTENLGLMPRFDSITSAPVPVIPPPFVTPVTPVAIFNYDVDNQLHTPYSMISSFGIQRALPGGLQFEADYYGRFGRRLFVLADAGQTMDFTSDGQKLSVAFTNLEKDAEAGDTPAQVAAQPFFESLFGPGSTQPIYAAFSNQGSGPASTVGSAMAEGNTGLMVLELGLQPLNIGLTPQFFVNALATNLGSSSYNSLFVTLRKRLSNNLQFDFDYTYSHSIDNNSTVPHANGNFEPGVTTVLCDATNAHVCRGNSEFDATNQITGYFVYDLPFGRGQRFAGTAGWLLNEAIGGWELSGVETWRTGLALTADSGISSTTSLAADAGQDFIGPRSALASDIHLLPGTTTIQYFKDPVAAAAAFTPALGLTVGTRDNLRGPHFSDLDFGVAKAFPLWSERYKLTFRADAFNVFNHTNFALYDPTLTSTSTFGTITSEAGQEPSRVMQFALRFDF
jgi:Carboxypeptidase regulatory-like domain